VLYNLSNININNEDNHDVERNSAVKQWTDIIIIIIIIIIEIFNKA